MNPGWPPCAPPATGVPGTAAAVATTGRVVRLWALPPAPRVVFLLPAGPLGGCQIQRHLENSVSHIQGLKRARSSARAGALCPG